MKYDSRIHHRRSVRLKEYDYSQNGAYFVTICVDKKKCLFGKIIDGKMVLNSLGKRAEKHWKKIEELHSFLRLGEFVVMPNHVHGIIFIDNDNERASQWVAPTDSDTKYSILKSIKTSHQNISKKQSVGASHRHALNIQLPPKSLSSIINHYKGSVKKWANANDKEFFSWQRNYHEHVIRNKKSLNMIQEYIFHNPQTWKKDCFFMQ